MKWINWLIAIFAVSVLVVSCDQSKPDTGVTNPKPAKVEISPSSPDQISAQGGTIKLNLTANRTWSVSGVPQWLTVSPASGEGSLYKQEVVITVEENTGGMREAVLTFTAEEASKQVKIAQGHPFGSNAPANAIFFEALEASMGNFTIENVTVPQGLSEVWQHTAQYKCMKATAYFNNTNNCPSVLLPFLGEGNTRYVKRINKGKFVEKIVRDYGFHFGEYQNVPAIRAIVSRLHPTNLADFDRGYNL